MKIAPRYKLYPLTEIVSCFLILIIIPIYSFAQENYAYERMWPSFQQPWNFGERAKMAFDEKGNIYVAGFYTHSIFKFNSEGSLIKNWGSRGSENKQFEFPGGITVDLHGFVYITDRDNHRIQKFTSDGEFVTTWGSHGITEGKLGLPTGIAADQEGNIYVVENINNRVQKFDSEGGFIKAWGSHGSENGQFKSPYGIAIDQAGNIYITDTGNNRIEKFTSKGEYIKSYLLHLDERILGGIAVDKDNNIYVTDASNLCRVLKLNQQGIRIVEWGGEGTENGWFLEPSEVAVDHKGNVYVTDNTTRIQIFEPNGTSITLITKWGSLGYGNGEFASPQAIAEDTKGNIYVVEYLNHRVQKFAFDGSFVKTWGRRGTSDGNFFHPYGITIDASDNIYVTDSHNHRIQKFNPDGIFIKKWGEEGTQQEQFKYPGGIACDQYQDIYVADTGNNRIQKFSSDGTFIVAWDGSETEDGEFNAPGDIAIDSFGNIYVSDTNNHRIQVFNENRIFVRQWGNQGSDEGQFFQPLGITIDSMDYVYVTDRFNHRIQKFSSDGNFKTMFGEFGSGPGSLYYPRGIYFSSSERIYISDENNRVQVFKRATSVNRKKVIIVAGSGPYPGNNLWDATQMCANHAYWALNHQGYTKETIYYLSHDTEIDLDGNGIYDDVDGDATNANLQKAITEWASDVEDLFIYLTGHGGNGTFTMRQYEILDAGELDIWIDTLQETLPGKVVVVYDACQSGSFISQLKPPSGKERVVAASTALDQEAVFAVEGNVSFSYMFWTRIFNGSGFYDSFVTASRVMELTYPQTPQIEANGNGTGNEIEDKTIAQSIKFTTQIMTAADPPSIKSVSPAHTLKGETSFLIYADTVVDADGISRVWAVITPPGYSPGSSGSPVTELPLLELKSVGDDRYEAVYDDFLVTGNYNIAVYATDRQGSISLPKQTNIIKEGTAIKGDINGIDNVTLEDAVIALKVVAGNNESGMVRTDYIGSGADVDGGDKIEVIEAVFILRKVAGL